MRKSHILVIVILVLSLVISSLLGGCESTDTNKLKVVTSTSMMAQIVERVGGDLVLLVNILPPTQCPGHYDVTPGDIQQLADADLFLMHGWQGEMFAQKLIDSADNPDLTVITIAVKGINMTPPPRLEAAQTLTSDYWMTPPVQLEATDMVIDTLCQVDATHSADYQEAAAEYKDEIEAKEAEIRLELEQANVTGVNVICAEMQAGFVDWVGLNIVATFGRPDSLTPQVVQDLVDQGREENVTLIIDNLHSGVDAGKPIALDIGCERIILSNFPGGFDNTETWEKAIDENIRRILKAITQ